ncbi:MAG: flagellin lysine-N-methylase [Firmicutes bacterium]|nr:flagellin lysine-N-methylase [Bacillota bacterium]
MLHIVPNYYSKFNCIASACRHNCCIGWEIDIDEDTAKFYQDYSGPMSKRLQTDIDFSTDPPHFILGKHERCPFLNAENLCDIIIEMGEEHICQICTDHPRFHNELPGRLESGLGLCCEEAARIILNQKEPAILQICGDPSNEDTEDEIITYRDEVLSILQNHTLSIEERIDALQLPIQIDVLQWIPFLQDLEILDAAWTQRLTELNLHWQKIEWEGFAAHMADRMTEYEQLLVYLIYRHMANAPSLDDADARAAFAVLGYRLVYALGAVIFTLRGGFSFEDQVELSRLFSSEIEYCEDNLYAIFDELYESKVFLYDTTMDF